MYRDVSDDINGILHKLNKSIYRYFNLTYMLQNIRMPHSAKPTYVHLLFDTYSRASEFYKLSLFVVNLNIDKILYILEERKNWTKFLTTKVLLLNLLWTNESANIRRNLPILERDYIHFASSRPLCVSKNDQYSFKLSPYCSHR